MEPGDPTPEDLDANVYLSNLSDSARATLDAIKAAMDRARETPTRESAMNAFAMGAELVEHAELGRIPPNILLRYLDITEPLGLAEKSWLRDQQE